MVENLGAVVAPFECFLNGKGKRLLTLLELKGDCLK
jgi:hypothetical protein